PRPLPGPRGYSEHAAHDTRSLEAQGAQTLNLQLPQHAHAGMVVVLGVSYRNLKVPARIHVRVPAGLQVQRTDPEGFVGGDGVTWAEVQSADGAVTFKVQVDPQAT